MANLLGWLGNGVKRLENTVNNDVVQPVSHAVTNVYQPVQQAAAGLEGTARASAAAPYSAARFIGADITHNQIARQNAINALQTAQHSIGGFAQWPGSALGSIGATIANHPNFTPTNNLERILAGNHPTPSIQGAYNQSRNSGQSIPTSLTKAGIQAASDLPVALKGIKVAGDIGVPAVKAVKSYDASLNQIGAVGKNVNKPNVPEVPKEVAARANHPGKVEMVPTAELAKYAEFDRNVRPKQLSPGINEPMDELRADIAKNGIKEPLILNYGAKDRIAALGEGNHRLAIAKELGITHLPVEVTGTQLSKADQLAAGKGFAHVKGSEPDQFGYVPNNQKPSEIGVKTAPSVTQPTQGAVVAAKPSPALPKVSAKTRPPTPVVKAGQGALSSQELSMGKALGMNPKLVAKAKAEGQAPPLTSIPKQAGKVEKVPFSMKPRPQNNPMTPGPLDGTVKIPKVLPGDSAQAHLNADFVAGHIKKVGSQAEQAVKGLSENDQKLMQQIQTKGVEATAKKADNPTAFTQAESALRHYYDTRIAYDHAQGIATPYRKDYLRDLIPPSDSTAKFEAKGGNLTPGYTQAKTVPGATPVLEGLQKDIAGSSFNHAKLAYAQGMEQAFPGQINRGAPLVGPNGVSQQLTTPYGNELFATKDLANKVNKRTPSAAAEGALGKYDKVNALAKYIKLGGGAFHALTEAGNFTGQQLASGKLFSEPGSTAKVFRTFFSDKALKSETNKMAQSGALENAQRSGLTWTPEAIKADITVAPHGKLSTYTGIKALHDATFRREIPYMKLKTFEQKTQGLDRNNPQDLAKMRTIAKSVNAEFGGINRAVEGVSPQNAKRWSRILLASDFTESKITTLKNAISKGGEEGKLAREVVAGKALLFGGLAAGGAVLGGELNGKNTNDKIASLTGKILDPSFNFGSYKVSLPATHVSEFTKPFKSFGNGSTDKFSGLKHYATGRLAAVPSEVNQLVNNQDYKGAKIYGGTKNKPISGKQAAINVASGIVPIPGSQGIAAATGQQSPAAAIANTLGLRAYKPTPTKAQQTQKQAASQNLRTETQAKAAKHQGQTIEPVLDNAGNKRFVYSTNDGMVKTTATLSTAQHAIQIDSFKNSDAQTKLTTDRYYYKDSTGGVHYKSIDAYNKSLAAAKTKAAKSSKGVSAKRSGGRASGKVSGKALTTKFKTASLGKVARPKGVSVRKLTAPSFKAPKTVKLSISKIPVVSNRRKA